MRDSDFLPWSEMKEHMHYIAWLLFTLVSFPLGGHAAVLVLCVYLGEYVEIHRLILTVAAAGVLVPIAYLWRKYGEKYCRFAEFDALLDRCLQRGPGSHLARIEAFITAIDRATGMERQLARNAAKAWLQTHASDLSSEERDFAAEHLGYLMKARQSPPHAGR